jgi:hypothetical protein
MHNWRVELTALPFWLCQISKQGWKLNVPSHLWVYMTFYRKASPLPYSIQHQQWWKHLQIMSQMKHKEIHHMYCIMCMMQKVLISFNTSKYDLSIFMVTDSLRWKILGNWPLQYTIKIPHSVSVQLFGYEGIIALFSKHCLIMYTVDMHVSVSFYVDISRNSPDTSRTVLACRGPVVSTWGETLSSILLSPSLFSLGPYSGPPVWPVG